MSQQEKGGLGRGLGALLPRVVLPSTEKPNPASDTGSEGRDAHANAGGGRSREAGNVAERDGTHAAESARVEGESTRDTGTPVVRELEIGSIKPNPRQPRTIFDDRELDELAASIREVGVLQPILVRQLSAGGFELVAGERRLRASLRAGRSTIPALVRTADDDATTLLAAFVENVQRVDLNPLEEAAGFRALIDDLGATHDDVARRVGKSRAAVTNALRLLGLAPEVQRRVADGQLSAAHARTLAALADASQQVATATRVVSEGLSVRATESLVKQLSAKAPLTEHAARTRAARALAKTDRPAAVLEAERLLAERLDTTVRLEHPSSGRGRIVVEYAGIADLTRIVDRMTRA